MCLVRYRRSLAFASSLVWLTACGAAEAPAYSVSRAQTPHGLVLGQRLGAVSVACPDGPRDVGAKGETQLITFATAKDCSSCILHMSGLDALKSRDSLLARDMLVVWLEPGMSSADLSQMRRRTPRTVCVDSAGVFWDRDNLQHTPVTVVLRDGAIVYMHDGPLEAASDRTQLIADLQRFGPIGAGAR